MNALTHPASLIRQSFASLWSKGFRAAHAAEKLGLSEGQAWAAFSPVHAGRMDWPTSSLGVQQVTWLKADWPALLQGLQGLGAMAVHVRNRAVHVRSVSACRQVRTPDTLALVQGDAWDARCFWSRWHAVAHVLSTRDGVPTHSVRVFDAHGRAVCQFSGQDEVDHEAWQAWVAQWACPVARPVFAPAPASPGRRPPERPADEVDLLALGDAWGQLGHARELAPLLARHQVGRAQAYRLMEGVHTRRTPLVAIEHLWRLASEIGSPWSLYAGNAGAALVVQAAAGRVSRDAGVLTFAGGTSSVRVRMDPLAESWMVTLPGAQGAVHRLELFDEQGGLILGVEGQRAPGQPESPAWRLLLLSLSVGGKMCAGRCSARE